MKNPSRFPLALKSATLTLFFLCAAGHVDAADQCYEFYPKGGNQVFKAVTSNATVIKTVEAQLKMKASERDAFISGKLARGDGGHNAPWSWHFIPADWSLAEFSIEVCDGEPNYVERNLDTWMEQVGRYCPWGGMVIGACKTSSVEPGEAEDLALLRLNTSNGLSTIAYSLPQDGNVSLRLLRIDGTQLAMLEEGPRRAGLNSLPWNGDDIAPGVFRLVLMADGKVVASITLTLP